MSGEKIDITKLAENLKNGVAKKSTLSGKKPPVVVENLEEISVAAVEEEKESVAQEKENKDAIKAKPTQKKQSKAKKDKAASVEALQSMIDEINALEGFDHEGIDYIDSEIHEVLKRLKSSSKLKIYNLTNYLFSEWILKNQDAINDIINQPKKNRFIK